MSLWSLEEAKGGGDWAEPGKDLKIGQGACWEGGWRGGGDRQRAPKGTLLI